MKRPPILTAILFALAVPALAATPATRDKTAKPKCPKGQIPLTSTITGDHYCAAMGGVSVMGGGPQPIVQPVKPAKKP